MNLKLNNFLQKIQKFKKESKVDLSVDEDLSIALMHLISLEEHFFFTAQKTEKHEYFDFVTEVRTFRKSLQQHIVKEPEGEIWCVSKHLLGASMRLIEVGNKELDFGKKEKAYDFFAKAYQLYNMFWGINLKVIKLEKLKKIDELALTKNDPTQIGIFDKLNQIVKNLINCCRE